LAYNNTHSPPGKDYTLQRLLLGTHTAEGEQNYLQIAQVILPNDTIEPKKQENLNGGKCFYIYFYWSWEAISIFVCLEMGGYGGVESRISVIQKINHDGEVNR
jgi:hypothetical protein